MTPFQEALLDAVLEEFDNIETDASSYGQDARRIEENMDLERTSLWLDAKNKYIYLHPTVGAGWYFFRSAIGRDMFLDQLQQSGFALQK